MDYLIYQTSDPHSPWKVRVGNCDYAHAKSVFLSLKDNPDVPDDLTLVEAPPEKTEAVTRVSLLRRIFRG